MTRAALSKINHLKRNISHLNNYVAHELFILNSITPMM